MTAKTLLIINPATLAAADHLLPILYRSRTLACALSVGLDDVLDWVDEGLPHQSDRRGQIRIHGNDARSWLQAIVESQSSVALQVRACCIVCRSIVMMQHPATQQIGRLSVYRGTCPNCGAPLYHAKRG